MRWIMAWVLVGGSLAATIAQAARPAQTAPSGAAHRAAVVYSPDMTVAQFMARVDQLRPSQPNWPLSPEAEIDSDVQVEHLASYSGEAAARTAITAAFSQLVRRRFPCR